jgi:hypothetical protein
MVDRRWSLLSSGGRADVMYGKGDVQASKIRSAAAPNGDTRCSP